MKKYSTNYMIKNISTKVTMDALDKFLQEKKEPLVNGVWSMLEDNTFILNTISTKQACTINSISNAMPKGTEVALLTVMEIK